MIIQLARHMGLCFGVKDAIQLAEETAVTGPVTIYGPLAHNEHIQQRMQSKGVRFVDAYDQSTTQKLIITAHGTSDRQRQAIREAGFETKDATCPLVHFAHRTLMELVRAGYYPVVIGKRDHIEVRGLTGDLSEYSVVLHPEEIASIPPRERLGIVSQTTQPIARVQALVEQIKKAFPHADVVFRDTVCQPTKQRQKAAEQLSTDCDVVVVIGGRHSNNTHQLAETIAKRCPRVHLIQGVADLNRDWFRPTDQVGITAGTSTPDEVIQPVADWLHDLANEWAPKAIPAVAASC